MEQGFNSIKDCVNGIIAILQALGKLTVTGPQNCRIVTAIDNDLNAIGQYLDNYNKEHEAKAVDAE